ncbi:hypothetical protein AB0J83_03345 [Actinoplanes sp. NPDC049596]|uniref:hypothetical protein n=1 Tax=unclassified Actinoplanes TaxID=2626549 RepID=UPI00342A6789
MRLNLLFGISEFGPGLKAAARLDLRVRWYVDGGKKEVPAPGVWPHPNLDEDDHGTAVEDR